MLTPSLLDTYVGHSISEICPYGDDDRGDNHGSHFASHVMQNDFGYTCARAQGRMGGANCEFRSCSRDARTREKCSSAERPEKV